MRATAIYKRISKDRMGLEYGVQRQDKLCRDLVRARQLDREGPTWVYSDNDISATKGEKAKRRGYRDLMAAVERGEVSRIVVFHLSRLWRNRSERAAAIEILRKHRVSVICVQGPEFDMATATGRSLAAIIGEFDSMESDINSERLLAWSQDRTERGLPPGGHRTFGYSPDNMEIIEDEAALVRQWFADFLAGVSQNAIARSAGVTAQCMAKRLINPRYAGLRVHNGKETEGAWPAIVAVETWRAACAIAAGRVKGRSHPDRKLLSGLVVCDQCDQTVKSHCDPRQASSRLYRCVRCSKTWGADNLELFIESVVRERLAAEDLTRLLPQDRPDLAKLSAEAQGITSRLAKLGTDFILLGLSEDQVKQANEAGKARLAEIQSALAEAGQDNELAELLTYGDPVQAYNASSTARKRAIIGKLMRVRLTAAPRGGPRDSDPLVRAVAYGSKCVNFS